MDYIANNIKDQITPYLSIQQHILDGGLFTKPAFKKEYLKYYKIYQKTNEWLDKYFKVFMWASNYKWNFNKILREFYKETGEIHPAHCSKILASLNPDKPLYQDYVIDWLGIVLKEPKDKDEKIDYFIKIYSFIDKEYRTHLNDDNIVETIKRFDEDFPDANKISNIKKLDFILMSMKDERRVSIFEYDKLKFEKNKKE